MNDNSTILTAIPAILAPKDVHPFGTAPGLKYKCLCPTQPRRYLLVFGKGDDVISGLNTFATRENIVSGNFAAIGAFQQAALAYYYRDSKTYKKIAVTEQSELVCMTGNIGKKQGNYVVHAHAAVSLADGATLGGHLLWSTVWPTVELFFTESSINIERTADEESGLSLISI